MIVRFEQINQRGESSRPRVDLNALGELLDRAALMIERQRHQLHTHGHPDHDAVEVEKDLLLALREVRSVRTRARGRVPCDRTRQR